jgi:hypothetical protein
MGKTIQHKGKAAMDFHKHVDENGEVLILKRIPQDRKTHGGFLWPSGVGTVVECPDWNPDPVCGGGLHGWPYGFGLGEGCDYDIISDIWLVLGAKPEDVVGELGHGAKCKARRVTIRLEGSCLVSMNRVRLLCGCDGTGGKKVRIVGRWFHVRIVGRWFQGRIVGR